MTVQPPDDASNSSREPVRPAEPSASPSPWAAPGAPPPAPDAPQSGRSEPVDKPVTAVPAPPTDAPRSVPPGEGSAEPPALPPLDAPVTAVPATGEAEPPRRIPMPPVSRAPAGSAFGYPARYAEAPGTGQFRFALPQLGTIVAGPAVGSMVAGIAALLVALGVGCAGIGGNVMVTIAATVLAVFCASAAGLLAIVAFRQIKRGGGEYRGRGMAITGGVCGLVSLGLVLLLLAVSLLAG